MVNRVCLVLAIVLSVWSARGSAETPAVRAWADSTSFLVGDPITVHVELNSKDKLRFTPLVDDTIGVFHVLSRDSVEHTSGATYATTLRVAAYDSGTAILPPIQFAYRLANDSATHTVATSPLIFKIHLVEVDTSKEIKDIKPPLSIPITLAELSLIIGAITGAALLVLAVIRYRKREKDQKTEAYVPPPKSAHVLALEELAVLKEKRLWQQGLVKPYYSEATEIIRRYFEHRFGFMSLEKTTDETMDDLRRFPAAHSILEQADRILRRADLVKFAKYQPTIPEHEEVLASAFEIVDRTKVVDITPAEKAEEKESVHV